MVKPAQIAQKGRLPQHEAPAKLDADLLPGRYLLKVQQGYRVTVDLFATGLVRATVRDPAGNIHGPHDLRGGALAGPLNMSTADAKLAFPGDSRVLLTLSPHGDEPQEIELDLKNPAAFAQLMLPEPSEAPDASESEDING